MIPTTAGVVGADKEGFGKVMGAGVVGPDLARFLLVVEPFNSLDSTEHESLTIDESEEAVVTEEQARQLGWEHKTLGHNVTRTPRNNY